MELDLPGGYDHPSWLTAVGTVVGYGVIMAVLTVLLFAVPWLVFVAI